MQRFSSYVHPHPCVIHSSTIHKKSSRHNSLSEVNETHMHSSMQAHSVFFLTLPCYYAAACEFRVISYLFDLLHFSEGLSEVKLHLTWSSSLHFLTLLNTEWGKLAAGLCCCHYCDNNGWKTFWGFFSFLF